jgi:SAM-dependent methyltransferase
MESVSRKSFQGITNIIRFNWHFYAFAIALFVLLMVIKQSVPATIGFFIMLFIVLMALSISLSLCISFYVYDRSNLYLLNWLDFLNVESGTRLVNIHAGFDETSSLLSKKFPNANLTVFDFYDPVKHTEVSIARARKAYPAYPDTRSINSSDIPLEPQSMDHIFVLLSAHEIRNQRERILFFKNLKEVLKKEGKIIVAEHLRDWPNFIAYTIGSFHFFSRKEWLKTFESAELFVAKEIKITPFITAFILQENGTAS